MIRLAADSSMIRKMRNRTRNRPARNFAMANDAPAMVVKPRRAARIPITRNTSAMWSMTTTSTDSIAKRMPTGKDGLYMDAFLDAAIAEAEQGLAEGGIPIGSVLVHRGVIIGRGHNRRVQQGS